MYCTVRTVKIKIDRINQATHFDAVNKVLDAFHVTIASIWYVSAK